MKINREIQEKLDMVFKDIHHSKFAKMVQINSGNSTNATTLVCSTEEDMEGMMWLIYSLDGHSLSGRRLPTSYFMPQENPVWMF